MTLSSAAQRVDDTAASPAPEGLIRPGRPWYGYIEEAAAAALLLAVAVVTAMGVLGRYTAATPLTWTEPAARYLLIWLTAVGAVVLFKNRAHIEVDFAYLLMPARLQTLVDWFVIFVQTSLGGYLLLYGWRLMAGTTASTSVPGVDLAMVYAAVPISAALFIAYGVRDAVHLVGPGRRSAA